MQVAAAGLSMSGLQLLEAVRDGVLPPPPTAAATATATSSLLVSSTAG